ncbi:MAG: methyltransferase type 11 [Microgenomates group bacterium GW2011_GWC1_37_8]|uniref:Methyltransferase type 11 domain-containing protein n=1 Tax=Candidatus Woesebacteria bacterium GW2011_GWB1_38_8 TaxID=1618570 RepID=A0A0G0NFF9_9BACT|nr:MAG: methyltransferase type 11 [Microgenomates group bacterium GW2011_GWC1_37_8]KKQ84594.1 MAG: hypothetical protein UT08_C0016G0008 [Candidatus Woesebacteria bacterium GW2011_GWB1_38_8]
MGSMQSELQKNPKSKILKRGYINIYSKLTLQEKRQIYYKTLYKKQNPSWDESLVYLSKKFKSLIKKDIKLVDVGCGNGNYLIDENRKNISWAAGVDIDKQAVMKNQCLDEVVIGDISNLPYDANYFDVATSLWVFEHLENPEKVVEEVYRVLKPKGKFLFVTPNYNFLPLRLIKYIEFFNINYLINRWLFGRKEGDIFKTFYKANSVKLLKRLLKNKFDIIELRTNYDPSYTSFNLITFKLSNTLNSICSKLGLNISHPHIIGITQKRSPTF